MEQAQRLWQYQQADMAADALENEIKRNPTRLALIKNRDFLVEQQNAFKRMEQEVAEMTDRVEVITIAIKRLEDQLGTLQDRFGEVPPENLSQAQSFSRDAQKLVSDLKAFEQEMSRIQKDASEHEQQEKEIRTRFSKVKNEYEKQKVAYDEQRKAQMKQLEEKRAIVAERSKDIEPELLERYRVIKQHCVPPVAKLFGGQCGGCNMNLPQVTLRRLRSGEQIIECETCGRLIIQI